MKKKIEIRKKDEAITAAGMETKFFLRREKKRKRQGCEKLVSSPSWWYLHILVVEWGTL